MPMGAVIFVDFWLIRKFRLHDRYAEKTGIPFNWAAGLTWLLTLSICLLLIRFGGIQIYFVSLPGWFIASALYIILSKMIQKNLGGLTA
jgi:purine-cytosine permease-like protein